MNPQEELEGRSTSTALHRACKTGNLSKVISLLQAGEDINGLNNYSETPLKVASAKGFFEIVKVLLNHAPDINYCPAQRINSYTEPALCAAVRGGYSEVVRALIDAGASLEAPSHCLFQPLHQALRLGHLQVAELLVERGASLESIDSFGETPLHTAVRSGSCEGARLLLDAGANINAIDASGMTPLHSAVESLIDSCLAHMLFELLKWRPIVDAKSLKESYSPAELAHNLDKQEAVEILCSAGAKEPPTVGKAQESSLDFIDEDGNTHLVTITVGEPIHAAADADLAAIVSSYKTPALLKNFGWQSSPGHWSIVERLTVPATLGRIAYFARNCCNRPRGTELDDALWVLGEQYHDAVNRLVDGGLIRKIAAIESIRLFSTVEELKRIAKMHSIKVSGPKNVICDTLASIFSGDELSRFVDEPRYVRTELAVSILEDKASSLASAEKKIQNHMADALAEGNLFCAALLSLDMCTLKNRPRMITERSIYTARITLSGELPCEVRIGKNQESRLRVIGAMNALCSYWDRWADFGVVKAPTHLFAGRLSPRDFADEIVAWSEHKERL